MTDRALVASPKTYARVAGLLYLIVIVAGIFAEIFVRGQLVVANDAAATAHNIVTHELKYRLGFAAELAVLRLVDHPHPPGAELAQDPVVGDGAADLDLHRRCLLLPDTAQVRAAGLAELHPECVRAIYAGQGF